LSVEWTATFEKAPPCVWDSRCSRIEYTEHSSWRTRHSCDVPAVPQWTANCLRPPACRTDRRTRRTRRRVLPQSRAS
jgi:hypothetical protein